MTEPKTITVALRRPDSDEPLATVSAYPVGEFFAVHRNPAGTRLCPWQVTHHPSGLGIRGSFWTAEQATAYAEAVEATPGDWSTTDGARAAAQTNRDTLIELAVTHTGADRKAWCVARPPEWPSTAQAGEDTAPPTADHMARWYAVEAQRVQRRSRAACTASATLNRQPDASEADKLAAAVAHMDEVDRFTDAWSIAYLLRALIEHAPAAADEIAGRLWSELDYGDTLGEHLWDWLVVDYRIDADAITAEEDARLAPVVPIGHSQPEPAQPLEAA